MTEPTELVDTGENTEAPAEATPTVNPQDLKKAIDKRDRFKSERDELAAKVAEYEQAAQAREHEAAEGDQAKKLKLLEKELEKSLKAHDELLGGIEARDKKDRNRAVRESIFEHVTDATLADAAYEKLVREGALEDGPEDAAEASKEAIKVMRKRFSSLFKPTNTQPPANAGQVRGVIPGMAQADPLAKMALKVSDELKGSGISLPPSFLGS